MSTVGNKFGLSISVYFKLFTEPRHVVLLNSRNCQKCRATDWATHN